MIGKAYMIMGALAIMGTMTMGAYIKGRIDGKWSERVAHIRAVNELNQRLAQSQEQISHLEVKRLNEVRERERQAIELNEAANEDPNANRSAISVDSVRRLNTLFPDQPQ